jgi:hypothetical protein
MCAMGVVSKGCAVCFISTLAIGLHASCGKEKHERAGFEEIKEESVTTLTKVLLETLSTAGFSVINEPRRLHLN